MSDHRNDYEAECDYKAGRGNEAGCDNKAGCGNEAGRGNETGRRTGRRRKVTIVIPNYNGLKFMEPCFKALSMQICRDFDILVVDNGSTDGSVEWLKEQEIPAIFLPENTGFSGAVNVGLKAAEIGRAHV